MFKNKKRFIKNAIFNGLVLPLLFFGNCFADISTVRHAHDIVYQLKNITIPIKSGVNPASVHTMEYLMGLIDAGNVALNGRATTDYANSTIANTNLVDVGRAIRDIDELIVGPSDFQLTVTNVSIFSFNISAAGNFTIDWGDGNVQTITRPAAVNQGHSHVYSPIGTYTIKISGLATGYHPDGTIPVISFSYYTSKTSIISMSGSLGAVFPTLANGSNPSFYGTFSGCTGLTNIPSELFVGIRGTPVPYMFASAFGGCTSLTNIPPGLFAGISGAPSEAMFNGTFSGCTGLTNIPPGLFAGISGAPASKVFYATFSGCKGLTSIPAGLFAGISGPPASQMYWGTFEGCTGLKGNIPSGLFGSFSGPPAERMFTRTFSGCVGLTGAIPSDLFAGISGPPAWNMFENTFYGCRGLTGIPSGLFADISGPPASKMFSGTFALCNGLSGNIPSDLFDGISGPPANGMFGETFYGCSGLSGNIPSGLFAGISGAPADEMFGNTFYGCGGLSGSIPAGLFSEISGVPAQGMFSGTFYGCTGLTGSVPSGLFGKFSGRPARNMFNSTFAYCIGLTGIEDGIWHLSGLENPTDADAMFRAVFELCSNITSPSPSIAPGNPKKLWQHFSNSISVFAFRNATKMADYASIPASWR